MAGAEAQVRGTVRRNAEAIAVLLHGASVGRGSTSWYAPAPLRMQPFVGPIERASRRRIGVLRVRHPDRDWNTVFRGARDDTVRLLAKLERSYPGVPIALVGHSNGGRVALRLSSDSRVHAIAALAPWIAPLDRITPPAGRPVLLMHGEKDDITSPRATAALAATLRRRGCVVEHETVPGENHALIARAGHWHRQVADFLVRHLLP